MNAYINAIEYAEDEKAAFIDWGYFHAGLAEYRKGNFNEAINYSIKSMSTVHGGVNHEIALKALNNAVLSLVYYKEGKRTQSIQALEISKYNQKEMRKLKLWFHDTYLAELLIAERQKLGLNDE